MNQPPPRTRTEPRCHGRWLPDDFVPPVRVPLRLVRGIRLRYGVLVRHQPTVLRARLAASRSHRGVA
ncbi:predicted protein [Streptomyces sviceus ATCC 29083]|uniref:Uncharacterized protein n=1 Tax=Streptomyces sviceus (strain ATCC 29083 / DSM 924 / JCM 4929 / NBRC 13980 / NCIMB 11184 / NRRL 5439 / UC 5370) TaxID=463191 RepID=D6XBT8_STRX2|nr:predicted protein [Streptomyces sviceus ATCC 29083]